MRARPRARLLFLPVMKIEPWDEPKKKEDAEPENDVSNEVPQQGEEKPGSVDLKKVRQKIKRAVGNKALHMVQKILDEDGTEALSEWAERGNVASMMASLSKPTAKAYWLRERNVTVAACSFLSPRSSPPPSR